MKQMKALECENDLNGRALFLEDLWVTCESSEDLLIYLNLEVKHAWEARYNRFLSLVIPVLLSVNRLETTKEIELREWFRKSLALDFLVELSKDTRIALDLKNNIKQYLNILPGYVEGASKQSAPTLEQHGYLLTVFFHNFFEF